MDAKDLLDPDTTPFALGLDLINVGMALVKLKREHEEFTNYLGDRKLLKKAKTLRL